MDKKPLIEVSICAVVLLVLGSLSNVVGYQTVQTSQQNLIKERINQRELLFQTIVDIANNKEIQRIIMKSQMMNGKFLSSDVAPITKQQLKQMYFLGLILSKVISKSKIQSMVQQNQLLNPITQEGINGIIEREVTLKTEINNLSTLNCDCQDKKYKEEGIIESICFILFKIAALSIIPLLILSTIINNMNHIQNSFKTLLALLFGFPFILIITCCALLYRVICWL